MFTVQKSYYMERYQWPSLVILCSGLFHSITKCINFLLPFFCRNFVYLILNSIMFQFHSFQNEPNLWLLVSLKLPGETSVICSNIVWAHHNHAFWLPAKMVRHGSQQSRLLFHGPRANVTPCALNRRYAQWLANWCGPGWTFWGPKPCRVASKYKVAGSWCNSAILGLLDRRRVCSCKVHGSTIAMRQTILSLRVINFQ